MIATKPSRPDLAGLPFVMGETKYDRELHLIVVSRDLDRYAQSIGLDMDQFQKDYAAAKALGADAVAEAGGYSVVRDLVGRHPARRAGARAGHGVFVRQSHAANRAAHVETLVALAEDAEGVGIGFDHHQKIQRRLLAGLQAVFGCVADIEQLANPAAHAVPVEPLRDRHAVEQLCAVGRLVSDIVAGDRRKVSFDPRRDWAERLDHFLFAPPRSAEVIQLRCNSPLLDCQVVELDAELGGESANRFVVRVDELSPELRHLSVGKVVTQAEHSSAGAVLRFDDAHRDAGRRQPVCGGQSGDAGAGDEDRVIAARGVDGGERSTTGECSAGRGRTGRSKELPAIEATLDHSIDDFRRAEWCVIRGLCFTESASDQPEQRSARHCR